MAAEVEESVSRTSKVPQFVYATAASFLTFAGGVAFGWSSPALHMYEQEDSVIPIRPTIDEGSWITALLTIGALFGAIPAGSICNYIGRKRSMMVFSLPLLASWGILYLAESIKLLYVARLLGGLSIGGISTAVPLYIAEIAEDSVRGTLGSFFQAMFAGGILFGYVIGALVSYYSMSLIGAAVPIIFLAGIVKAPESPIYLLTMGRTSQAEQSLRALRGPYADVTKELEKMEKEIQKQSKVKISFFKALARRETKWGLTITIGMMFSQQFSGINIVILYASQVFDSAGSKLDSQLCSIFIGSVYTVSTIVAVFLVDKMGRKILINLSAVLMAICLAILGYFFFLKDRGDDVTSLGLLPVSAVMVYVVAFGIGVGPLCWVMAGEVLSDDVKGVGTSITVACNWTLAFIVSYSFPGLAATIGNAGTYWLLSVFCLIILVFSIFVVIETKGKTQQEVLDTLAGRKPKPNAII